MAWIILFLLFLSFLFVYHSNKTFFYIYSILFPFVGFFLLNKVGYSLAYTMMNAELFAFIVIAIWQGMMKKYWKFLGIYLIVYLVYFFAISHIQHVSFGVRWNVYKGPLIFFLWGCMLLDDFNREKISIDKLRRFFINFLIFELILCSLQYLFEPIRVFFRDVAYIGLNGEVNEVRDNLTGGFMNGTFSNVTILANILAMFLVSCMVYFASRNLLNRKYILLIAATLFVIMLSGIRASLLFSLIMLFVVMIKYKQTKLIYIGVFFLAVVLLAGGIHVATSDSVGFESGGLARSISLFGALSNESISEQTTLALTFSLFPYVIQNPLFGVGLHYKGGYALPNTNFYLEDYSFTDATLFFELAEIGILGILIYLLPLWKFMNMSSINKTQYLILFVLLILSTIVDSGFMTNNMLLLFFFSVVFFVDERKSSYSRLKSSIINKMKSFEKTSVITQKD